MTEAEDMKDKEWMRKCAVLEQRLLAAEREIERLKGYGVQMQIPRPLDCVSKTTMGDR